MNDIETNDYLELNKDIYGKRSKNTTIDSTLLTHAFGGKGNKDAETAIYNGVVHTITSSSKENTLNWITYDTNKGWGETFENPKRTKIICNNDIDEDNISASQLNILNKSPISNIIKIINNKSGFIIFGELKDKYLLNFKKDQQYFENLIKKHCNDNLKKCKVKINDSILNYNKLKNDDKYCIHTTMNLWESSKTNKYVLSFTHNKKEYYLKKTKKCLKLDMFKSEKYIHVSSFKRKDTLIIENIENLFYRQLLKNKDIGNIQRHTLDIHLVRLGTTLIPCLNKISPSVGTYWCRDINYSFNTKYYWNPDYNLDKLFQISGDKLNPNILKIKDNLTSPSYKLLISQHINNLLIKKTNFKILTLYTKIKEGMNENNTYKFINENYETLKSELKHKQKLVKWFKNKTNTLKDDITQNYIKLSKVVDEAVYIAEESANYVNIIVNNLENYLNDPYFIRDNAIKNAMNIVKKVKNESDRIILECSNMTYRKKIYYTAFYYKINNHNINNNFYEFDDTLMVEAEIGVSDNSVYRRHPKENIQFITYINADGSRTIQGNKRVIEKKVINALKKIPGIKMGTKEHPRSTEQFRFPINKRLDVFHKIIDNVRPYEEEGDIFVSPIY